MIIALITLYNPDQTVIDNIKTIIPQADKIYLSDNSPDNHESTFMNLEKVEYRFNNGNMAISGAFNRILKDKAIDWSNDDYVIFFDQDSSIKPNHITRLIKRFDSLIKHGINVGCLGPVFFNRSLNKIPMPKIKKRINKYDFLVKSIITSSMLSKYGILKDVGFWNEDVFLDMADWDICWRLRAKGYECVETEATVLNHAVGSGNVKVGPINIRENTLVREYYQSRNYLYLLHKKYVPIKYKLRFIQNLTIRPILHYFYLDNGEKRMQYIREGIRDYKKGYFGEYRG